VVDVLPRPRGLVDEHLATLGVGEVLHATMVVAPGLDGIAAAHRTAATGGVAPEPLFLSNVPSVLDPTVGPPDGGHVFSLETLFTPYNLDGGWSGSPEPERWLAAFARLVEPGFLEGVRRWRLVGPEDYERDFSMPAGYAPSFAGGPLAALLGRDRELTRYATPVPGLYLTGSGTFPGAGVSGAPGRNAAHVVLAAVR
jgi:phytoene dehydrogenase-like protein